MARDFPGSPVVKNPTSNAGVLSHFSHVRLFAPPWTVARQAPLSMGFSRQEYWIELPGPPPGDHPNPGSNPGLLHCRQILYHLSNQGSPKTPHARWDLSP